MSIAGIVKSTALGSLASLVLAALKNGPAAGTALARSLKRREIDVRAACRELARLGQVRREGRVWALVPAARCQGLNYSGDACRRFAAEGSFFCRYHRDQEGQRPLVPKGRSRFDIESDLVWRALGLDQFPSVADLAALWPRVVRLYNSAKSTRFERAWNYCIEHWEEWRHASLAAQELWRQKAAAGQIGVDHAAIEKDENLGFREDDDELVDDGEIEIEEGP